MKDKIISLSFFWLKVFDKQKLLFKTLKSFNIWIRYMIYIFVNIAFYFFADYLLKISSNYIKIYNFNPIIQDFFINSLKFVGFIALIFCAGIFLLEFLMKIDVEKYQNEKEDKEKYIKTNKLQWWRLRNCHFMVRIFIYAILFFCCFLMILQSFLLTQYNNPLPLNFVEFGTFLKQFLAIYVIVFMLFDYKFVQKARKKILEIKSRGEIEK